MLHTLLFPIDILFFFLKKECWSQPKNGSHVQFEKQHRCIISAILALYISLRSCFYSVTC